MTTIDDALRTAIQRLTGYSASPQAEAQSLLAHVLQVPRETLLAHPERVVSAGDLHTFDHLLALLVKGMPLPYLVGTQAFYDRVFRVTQAVLIPRPETELLIEQALRFAQTLPKTARLRLIDIGTGSGVIAITLAAHLSQAQVIGSDISAAALLVAQNNAKTLPVVSNVQFVQADLWASITGQFQIIVSNLPYIATADLSTLDVAHFEPYIALDGGPDGLMFIRQLLQTAPQHLATPGLLLIEHAADQGPAALALMRQAFPLDSVMLLKDDAGLDRAVRVERR